LCCTEKSQGRGQNSVAGWEKGKAPRVQNRAKSNAQRSSIREEKAHIPGAFEGSKQNPGKKTGRETRKEPSTKKEKNRK